MNKKKSLILAANFYGSIILSLIFHYFVLTNWNMGSTAKVAITFLVFNIIFGILNISFKVRFFEK